MLQKLGWALCLTLVVACEKKEQPAPTTETMPETPTPAATVATPAAAAAQPSVDLATLPVEEDFEEIAETELTAANIGAKLDELEKEIDAK